MTFADPTLWQAIAGAATGVAIVAWRWVTRERARGRSDAQIISDAADELERLLAELAEHRTPATPTPRPPRQTPPRERLQSALRAARLGARPDGRQR